MVNAQYWSWQQQAMNEYLDNNIKTYTQTNDPETQRDRTPNYSEDAICPVYQFLCLTTEAKSHQNEKEKNKINYWQKVPPQAAPWWGQKWTEVTLRNNSSFLTD